jgi:maltose alpha-D-glucosyltransferase / alpha-amylase
MEEALRIRDSVQPAIQAEWQDLFSKETSIHQLENQVLPAYLKRMRWFGGKSRPGGSVIIYQNIPIPSGNDFVHYLLLKVRYPDSPTEIYALPLAFVARRQFQDLPSDSVVARLENTVTPGFIIDAIYDESFRTALYKLLIQDKLIAGKAHYPFQCHSGKLLRNQEQESTASRVLKAEQSNSSIIYNETFFLKFFRKLEYTINPDLEIIRFLTDQDRFHQIPAYAGSIEIHHPEKPPMLAVMLQKMVPNQGNAWDWNQNQLKRYYADTIQSGFLSSSFPGRPPKHRIGWEETPERLQNLIGKGVYEQAVLLGKRTAELHLALAADQKNLDFKPEPVDKSGQQQFKESLLKLVDTKFDLLMRNLIRIPQNLQQDAKEMLEKRENVKTFIQKILSHSPGGSRIRTHGDYHLGQVLVSGDDLVILDFEGEPDKAHELRRKKTSPLKDVAGMMRSYRYAAYASLLTSFENDYELRESLLPVADLWYHFVSRYFLGAYLQTVEGSNLIPDGEALNDMLQMYSFEKAIYELGYEINNRPDWAIIPLISLVKFVKFYLK